LTGNLREGDHLEDPGVDVRIILKWIAGRGIWGMDWIDVAQHRDTCECGNKSSGSIKFGEYLD
jgi:hypothetical protein